MILSRQTKTPIPFWLEMPFREFREWVKTNNMLITEEEQKVKAARKR